MKRVLVVGAAPSGLGFAVADAVDRMGWSQVTAGIQDEDYALDVVRDGPSLFRDLFRMYDVDHVVCTVGINEPSEEGAGSLGHWYLEEWLRKSYETNVIGPMRLLREFLAWCIESGRAGGHFVAVSSNSAHIARSNSMAYCSSKAALSMAIRCAAREQRGRTAVVYGYELGLLRDTPMTRLTEHRFGPTQTRIPGSPRGLDTGEVAAQIAENLRVGGRALNGVLLRLDGGEQ